MSSQPDPANPYQTPQTPPAGGAGDVIATAPCPQCNGTAARKVRFTWWGGALGPKLLSHVHCANCGSAFNARTGKPNTRGIAIYIVVTTAIGVAVLLASMHMRRG